MKVVGADVGGTNMIAYGRSTPEHASDAKIRVG